jgi:hypothetical protein
MTCPTAYASAEGIPSIGMSPFACGWSTQQRKVRKLEDCYIIDRQLTLHSSCGSRSDPVDKDGFAYYFTYLHLQLVSANASQIIQSLHAGFVPVSCCT